MYNGDSFFTLDGPERIGLVLISLAMAAILIFLVRKLPGKWWLRLGTAAVIFYAFVWLSPQAYYTYYRMIFNGLPAQWVIGPPPGLGHIGSLLSFSGENNLSSHGQGLLGWALALTSVLRKHQ